MKPLNQIELKMFAAIIKAQQEDILTNDEGYYTVNELSAKRAAQVAIELAKEHSIQFYIWLSDKSPYVEQFKGFIVFANNTEQLKSKLLKINQGDTNGFWTIDRAFTEFLASKGIDPDQIPEKSPLT